jgi:hypothetical protein
MSALLIVLAFGSTCQGSSADPVASADSGTRLSRPVAGADKGSGKQPYTLNAELNGSAINPQQFQFAPPGAGAFSQGDNQPYDLNTQRTQTPDAHMPPPALDVTDPHTTPPVLEVTDPNRIRLLANYQVELIVDRSLSMRHKDCPGGLSRWAWCGMQAEELARALYPYAPNGLTITAFAWQYEVYQQVSASLLTNIFQHPNFAFGTRLAEPLTNRLNNFFNRRFQDTRPLLVGVITDGVPVPVPEPMMVRNELISASKALRGPSEVTVVFFQIGGKDAFGHRFLHDLDVNLVRHGARYPYVHTVPFERLTQIGLARALVETVQNFAPR